VNVSNESVRTDDRRKVAVVTTTINVPCLFKDMLENADSHGHGDQVTVVVVGDRKTPPAAVEFLAELSSRHPAEVEYLDLDAQRELLRPFPELDSLLRYDSVQRRNIGFLQAAIDGAEVVISVDDDNYPTEDDFIGHHLIVGQKAELPVISHESGWWNACRRLVCDPPRRFYHRGYPKSMQNFDDDSYSVSIQDVRPVVNAGLWLGTPDVDATTHMEEPINVVDMEPVEVDSGEERRSCALAPGTWCPVNSQNTAFSVELLPAMYLAVMGEKVGGYPLCRMDDIWLSYFVRAMCDKLGDVVAYGPPLVMQERNPHDVLADLAGELPGYIMTERLVRYLREFDSEATSYGQAYVELTDHLRESIESDAGLERPYRDCLRNVTAGMSIWHEVIGKVQAAGGHS